MAAWRRLSSSSRTTRRANTLCPKTGRTPTHAIFFSSRMSDLPTILCATSSGKSLMWKAWCNFWSTRKASARIVSGQLPESWRRNWGAVNKPDWRASSNPFRRRRSSRRRSSGSRKRRTRKPRKSARKRRRRRQRQRPSHVVLDCLVSNTLSFTLAFTMTWDAICF